MNEALVKVPVELLYHLVPSCTIEIQCEHVRFGAIKGGREL